jgi:Coenzyme PQQ synthesis protein D (PqqD)
VKKKNDKKSKPRLPTLEEMLSFRPVRNDKLSWSKNSECLVEIKVPKFYSNIGKSFCKLVRKEQNFTAKMDKIGSVVWEQCDGQKTVEDILKILKEKYPKEKEIDQRLFLFLQQMGSLNYIYY